MPICPKCHKLCKTEQGLAGHLRFRHQMTIPKQSLDVYARDRIERAEAENARLREQLNRSQRQRQDLETFYDKKVGEQNTQLKEMQIKTTGQQVESTKQQFEQSRLQQTLEEQRTALQKQMTEFQKNLEDLNKQKAQLQELSEKQNKRSSELEKRLNQVEKQEQQTKGLEELKSELEKFKNQAAQNSNPSRIFSRRPPLPDPNPFSAVRNLAGWLHQFNH